MVPATTVRLVLVVAQEESEYLATRKIMYGWMWVRVGCVDGNDDD